MTRRNAGWLVAVSLFLCACGSTPQGSDPTDGGDGSNPSSATMSGTVVRDACPTVFADAFPQGMRSDEGPRGLTALRGMVKDSLAKWSAKRATARGRYSYTRLSRSYSGWYCETVLRADDGVVTSRTELSGVHSARQEDTVMVWSETGDDLDSHASACHPVVTMEALYDECLNTVLCQDPRENDIYLTLDPDGLLLECSFLPHGCADHCLQGVSLKDVRLGADVAECCPVSGQPACCMQYGGADLHDSCTRQCDGMPLPGAPWRLELDEYDCPHWVEPPMTDECCGCQPP